MTEAQRGGSRPDISVYILTYFHERYVREAVNSVLMQKTDYSYEIVIADDCSKDKTGEILEELAAQHPSRIRVFFNPENIGIPRNIFIARCRCRGSLIVSLSGDDYWIDDRKLQKQADFLMNHPEYTAVCNALEVRYDEERTAAKTLPSVRETGRDYTVQDYERGKILHLHGFMMRNVFLTEEGRRYFAAARTISDRIDDSVDVLLLISFGRVHVLADVMNVYRVHYTKKGSSNYNARYTVWEKIRHNIDTHNNLYDYFHGTVNLFYPYMRIVSVALLQAAAYGQWKAFGRLYATIPVIYRKPIYRGLIVRSIPKAAAISFDRLKRLLKSCINRLKRSLRGGAEAEYGYKDH